jgi:ADP-L-glycero-D-manno-heptose 6-epimerase
VTGGAGFIGSAFLWQLNEAGHDDILVVDHLAHSEKWRNLVPRRFTDYVDRTAFLQQLPTHTNITAIVHLGACSATTETNADYLMENNYRYTKTLAEYCLQRNLRFIYASSGATYGDGSLGFDDDDAVTPHLHPLNMYGYSKHLFDLWALRTGAIGQIAGVKFFNVFGPNEYHKGGMQSLLCRAFSQVRDTKAISLFQSERAEFADGEQKRDFIYVKDGVRVLLWLLENPQVNGLYNLGTGQARSWNDVARALFAALNLPESITYVPLPDHLRGKYQYFTEAKMEKLRAAGYTTPFTPLEEAVADYVTYLTNDNQAL